MLTILSFKNDKINIYVVKIAMLILNKEHFILKEVEWISFSDIKWFLTIFLYKASSKYTLKKCVLGQLFFNYVPIVIKLYFLYLKLSLRINNLLSSNLTVYLIFFSIPQRIQ